MTETHGTAAAMTAEARELREVITRLVEERGRTGTLEESLRLWGELVDLGLRDIGLPEDRGGSGGTLAELTAVAVALAERGVSVPLVEASVGHWAAATVDGATKGLITVGSVADPIQADVQADVQADMVVTLPWGRVATAAVVCAADQARLVPVQRVSEFENVAGEPLDTMSLDAETWRAAPVLAVPPALVLERAALLRAAALFGAARGAYTLTRGYTRERRQFGGPLLDLPAVAGHLATMKVELVQADAALTRAVTLVEEAGPARRASSAVQVATVIGSGVAGEVARLAHQLHGAIGITGEYPLHRFTRRIWAWRDVPRPAVDAARELGAAALTGGERCVWSELTGWCPVTAGD